MVVLTVVLGLRGFGGGGGGEGFEEVAAVTALLKVLPSIEGERRASGFGGGGGVARFLEDCVWVRMRGLPVCDVLYERFCGSVDNGEVLSSSLKSMRLSSTADPCGAGGSVGRLGGN